MDIITHRRALHRIPELDRDLPRTMDYLKTALEPLNCRVFSLGGSLCAFFDFGKADCVAFRSDADALPICDNTGAEYASSIPGHMHACGHDGHMAILLELAARLNAKKTMPHNVLLIFQCAEETTGGARELCREGIFENLKVIAIFGLHIWPGLQKGELFSKPGSLMIASREVHVDVRGRSAHIAKAHEGLDAMAAAVEFYRRAMALSAETAGFHLLKFGKLTAGTVCNAIADHARLEGSLRSYDTALWCELSEELQRIGDAVAGETGCAVEVKFTSGCPAVDNPADLFQKCRKIANFTEILEPQMTAEDFSEYQRCLPGLFFFLGAGDCPALHRGDFDFDEAILARGADFFEQLAEGFV